MNAIETPARRHGSRSSRMLVTVLVSAGLAGAGAVVAAPAANAADCTASGLATTASGVLSAAGGYLAAHPGANDVLTAAASQPADVAKTNIRGYFTGHVGEFLDLQNIIQPLKDLKNQCGVSISAGQMAALFEAIS